uniref:Selenoprotein W, 2a n=1 Tax=Labrus bergylta TaxID=56723 RepID=A0A3Q3EVN8_9LABR
SRGCPPQSSLCLYFALKRGTTVYCVSDQAHGVSVEVNFSHLFHFAGSFEIEVNGQLIFSKLELGGFPHEDDIRNALEDACAGKPVQKITKSKAPCTIM